jgi:hypothetical protein
MSVKSRTLYEMYQVMLRTGGQSGADDWVANNLSDEEIEILQREIDRREGRLELSAEPA